MWHPPPGSSDEINLRLDKIEEIWEEVEEGTMPPAYYTPMHSEARLSQEDRAAIQAWVQSESGGRSE